MSETKPLIVFSGGLDSSALLYEQLKKGDVYTCYIRASQHADKAEMEMARRPVLIKMFEDMTGHRVISDSMVDLGWVHVNVAHYPTTSTRTSKHEGPVPDKAWAQMHLWLHGVMHVVHHELHSCVMMGVLGSDDIAYRMGDIMQDWHYRSSFTKRHFVPLEFPMIHMDKFMVLEQFPLPAYKHVWMCELPEREYEKTPLPPLLDKPVLTLEESKELATIVRKYETVPCNECHACDDHAQAIWMWERRKQRLFSSKNETFAAAVANAEKLHDEIMAVKTSDAVLTYQEAYDRLQENKQRERYTEGQEQASQNECCEDVPKDESPSLKKELLACDSDG